VKPVCETCDGDGYVDIVDDWGGVIGPAPCPNCSPDDPLEAVEVGFRGSDSPRDEAT
jgi:hypothetical protein